MLVLSRKKSEAIVICESADQTMSIKVVILDIGNGIVRLGIEAPANIPVHRLEVWERLQSRLCAVEAT